MRVNQEEEFTECPNGTKAQFEEAYRAIKERLRSLSISSEERPANSEELVHSAGQLLAFCFKNDLIAEDADDTIVAEILSDGMASDTPMLLHKSFQTCMNFGKLRLSLLFGEKILESPNENWTTDFGLCPDLQATLAELWVMTKRPDLAVPLLQQCTDWPGIDNILKSVYHEQIARCYRVLGQEETEKYHIKQSQYFKNLRHSNDASDDFSVEDDYGGAEPVLAKLFLGDRGTISGDFLVWLGVFETAARLAEYATSKSDDWEPASQLNSAFGFALLDGQGYDQSQFSYFWTNRAQNVEDILAPLKYITELPELVAKEASRTNIAACNSAVIFHDANRTYFVENPFPLDSPLRYLGRFSYAEQGRFVAFSTDTYPSNMRLVRAAGCLEERQFTQAETFLRAELEDHRGLDGGTNLILLKLCLVLVASADEMYQFGQEVQGEHKFKEAMKLFSELASTCSPPELKNSDDFCKFLYHCENYAVRLENCGHERQALEIYNQLLNMTMPLYCDDEMESNRWKLAIQRCSA